MKVVICLIAFLTLAMPIVSGGDDYATKFSIRCNAKWTEFTNNVLQLLVSGKIATHQQAINFLRTFNIRGLGEFSDYTSGVAYTSATFESFGGDPNAATQFSYAIKVLISDREKCATAGLIPEKCADQTTSFLEAVLKLLISNQVISTKNATDLAVQFGATLTIPQDDQPTPEFGCYQKQYDFKKMCESQYGGMADGARCFFIPDVAPTTTWDNAWAACKNRSAILAGILTSSEMSKIAPAFKATYGSVHLWTSGKRTSPSNAEPGGTCAFPRNNTYVFTNASDYNPLLVYSNTWFRNRKCDEAGALNEQCIVTHTITSAFWDVPCGSHPSKPLCQISGPPQQYVRIDKVCVAEVPIVESTVTSANDCAASCSQNSWCRSFNIVGGNKCQLFPWWIEDKPNTSVNAVDCVHYTYVASVN
jgi:hypothetical protein